MSAIKVENLAYSYPGLEQGQSVRVFEDLDLQIEQGSFVAILVFLILKISRELII